MTASMLIWIEPSSGEVKCVHKELREQLEATAVQHAQSSMERQSKASAAHISS